MDFNSTKTTTQSRSVFSCPQLPFFTWDLNNTTFAWILVALISFASPVTVLLNSLIIIAVRKRKEMQKHSNILLSSLACADLLVGAVTMPLSVAVDILILRQFSFENVCTLDAVVNKNVIIFLTSTSLYHLTVIAGERYMAIQKWMDYRIKVTKERLKNLAIAVWLFSVFTKLPATGMILAEVDRQFIKIFRIGERVVVMACFVSIAYFYVMVYLGVRKRKISEISNVTQLVQAKLQSKLAKTTTMLTAALIFSFSPAIAIALLANISPVFGTNSAFRLTEKMVQLNSLVTPILYCYRDRRFRKAVLELVGMAKPEPVQRAVGAALFVRRKDPFGSAELENMQKTRWITRSASCDPVFHCVYVRAKPHRLLLKRSLSAPKLNELLGMQKPEPVQPAVGSAPFVRRKDPFGTAELQNVQKTCLTTRSASCDPAMGSDCAQAPAKPQKLLKRSLSAPKLNDCSYSLVNSQLHEPTSTAIAIARIDAESAAPRTARNDTILSAAHPTRKSWGHSSFLQLANGYRNMKEKTFRRPKTAPANIFVLEEACNDQMYDAVACDREN